MRKDFTSRNNSDVAYWPAGTNRGADDPWFDQIESGRVVTENLTLTRSMSQPFMSNTCTIGVRRVSKAL